MPVVLSATFAQTAFDNLYNPRIRQRGERLVRRQQVTPGCRKDHGLPRRRVSRTNRIALAAAAENAVGRHPEQGGQLGDDRGSEDRQPLFGIETASSHDDEFKSTTTRFQPPDLFEGANRRRDRREQLAACQLGLGLVVVDIEIGDRLEFRRITGLTGAQYDAQGAEAEFVTDALDSPEPRILALHHHIEQHDGHIAALLEDPDCLVGAERMQELEWPTDNPKIAESEFGRVVNIFIIIDDEQGPAFFPDARCSRVKRVVDNCQGIMDMHLAILIGDRYYKERSMASSSPKKKSPEGLSFATLAGTRAG